MSPNFGMPGTRISINGYNFAPNGQVTDKNWYLSEFGFYYQPGTATITVGTYECQLEFHNDTLIRCHVVYGAMYKPHNLRVAVHGKGNAEAEQAYQFGLPVYSVTPSAGSLAGGAEVTIQTGKLAPS